MYIELSAIIVHLYHDDVQHDAGDSHSCDCVHCRGQDPFDRFVSDCESELYIVEARSAGIWKEEFNTSEARIIIQGCSLSVYMDLHPN